MKKTITLFALIGAATIANAQSWLIDKSHSSVKFLITHMMVSEVEGSFKDFAGNVTFQKEDLSDLKADFTLQTKSVNTDEPKRDEHLRSADFFDAAVNPTITFTSASIKKVSDKKYELTGDLNLHGVTKKVKWDVKYNGMAKDLYGNMKAGFKCTTTIKRSDYKITWNKTLDAGLLLSDEVELIVNLELTKK